MKRETVAVWIYEGDIQINPEGAKTGDPCLMIPATKEAVWRWLDILIRAVEDGELDHSLPGRFVKISDDEGFVS